MSILSRILRQPLVHFLLIGLAVFGLFAAVNERDPTPSVQEIIITEDLVSQLAARFETVWRRPPSQAELDRLVDSYIREEILAREAVALSLDRNDTVIRRRLMQKMDFLTQSAASAIEPTDEELQAFFDANAENYASETAVAFDQVFLGTDLDEEGAEQLREDLAGGLDPATAGSRTLLPGSIPLTPRSAIDRTFGSGFFEGLEGAQEGQWTGPVQSGYGYHLVRVTNHEPGQLPPLDDVLGAVRRDWTNEQSRQIADGMYANMLQRYTIRRADLTDSGVAPQ